MEKGLEEIFQEVIESTSKATAKEVIGELKKQGLVKEKEKSPYQKVETLLYNYINFKELISDKHRQIDTIIQEGVAKKSHSITSFNTSDGMRDNKSDSEKAEEQIEEIKKSICVTENCIDNIDKALDVVGCDPYFDIIPMWYFDGLQREQIADYFNVTEKTITRNKSRLIDMLKIRLFSDEVIKEIFS